MGCAAAGAVSRKPRCPSPAPPEPLLAARLEGVDSVLNAWRTERRGMWRIVEAARLRGALTGTACLQGRSPARPFPGRLGRGRPGTWPASDGSPDAARVATPDGTAV